jgi:alpha-beta hydrolase superfamily lysophospholipase
MSPSVVESEITAFAANPKAALVIVHGLAEYAARYRAIARDFAARGISTFAYDQIGHGADADTRTHVAQFDLFVDDASEACDRFAERVPGVPLFVWGHSMGAIVALNLAARGAPALAGLIVSSNSLEVFKTGPNPLNPFFRFASRVVPKVRIPLGLDATKISHDALVQRAYANDPLIPATASLRLIVEFAQACETARIDAPAIRVPVLIVHGEADAIAPAKAAHVLFETMGSADKTRKIFPGARHEVHNEKAQDREMFLELLSGWILSRSARAEAAPPP